MYQRMLFLVFFCIGIATSLDAQDAQTKKSDNAKKEFKPDRKVVYKEVDGIKLNLHVFDPKPSDQPKKRSAIVFFFGGGWNGGNPNQFYPHCDHLAEKGMVAMAAEYRVKSRNKTTPFECVKDGKSAIRWIRANAKSLNIAPDRIAAGGGSAGGHVAAATGTVSGLEEPGEDQSVSCRPNALVLFNPVYDNGPDGWGHKRVAERYKEISPMHNIHEKMPPTIVFLGTKDKLIPVSTAEKFKSKMKNVGVRSELYLYEGQPHGFFNYQRNPEAYEDTVEKMDEFLKSLGYFD